MICSNSTNSQACGNNIAMENDPRFVPFNVAPNQQITEIILSNLFNITSSSQQCSDTAMPFFCKAAYRTCNFSRFDLFPTTNECVQLQNNTCKNQWKAIETFAPNLACCNIYDLNSTCPDQFDKFCGICAPLCNEFSQYGKATTKAITVAYWITALFGNLFFGIIVFVASFLKRKKM